MGGGGSQPSGNTTTVQKADPWGPIQPFLVEGANTANNLFNNPQQWPQYYPSSTVAPFNDVEQAALGGITNLGSQGANAMMPALGNLSNMAAGSGVAQTDPTFNSSNSLLQQEISGQFLDPKNNPGLQSVINETKANVLPQIQSGFDAGGRMDSGLATRAAASGLGGAVGNILYQNYAQERQNQNAAAALASQNQIAAQENAIRAGLAMPGVSQGILGSENAALGAGQLMQGQSQQELNDLVNRYNYGQMLPWNTLSMFENLIPTGQGGTTSLAQPYFTNPTANALAGITGAVGVGNALFGSQGMFPNAMNSLFSWGGSSAATDPFAATG